MSPDMGAPGTVTTTDTNVGRAARLDTTALSDALDRLGIAGQCLNIKPLEWTFQMTGRAYTILYGPSATPSGTVGDYIDEAEPGSVIVLDNGGRENATVWGDILTWVATRRGIAGTVIDGACRDTRLARELGYPIFSRSYSMRTGKDRVQVEGVNSVVNIGDARVAPGDILRGDADGVLVIPRAHEEAVLSAAEEIDATEQRIREAINAGKSLAAARRELGYHALQSRRK
jgi:regulator of RNase E activity RraA